MYFVFFFENFYLVVTSLIEIRIAWKIISEMTYYMSSGMLSCTHSVTLCAVQLTVTA